MKVVKNSIAKNKALIAALEADNLDAFKKLATKKNLASFIDEHGNNLLHLACKTNATNIAIFLLKQDKPAINASNDNGKTALHIAAKNGNLAMVKCLIATNKVTIDAIDNSGKTALHYATIKLNLKIAQILLYKKADPNLYDADHNTPLHYATGYLTRNHNNLPLVKLLLKYKADISSKDHHEQTPLQLSIHLGKTEVVNLLLQYGGSVDEIDQYSIWRSISNGNSAIVLSLIKAFPQLNLSCMGDNILHLAAKNGYLDIIEALIAKGIDLNMLNINKQTALSLACANVHEKIAIALIKAGAKLTVNGHSFWDFIKDDTNGLKKHLLPLLIKKQKDIFKDHIRKFMQNNILKLPLWVAKYYLQLFPKDLIIPKDNIRKFYHSTRTELLAEILTTAIAEIASDESKYNNTYNSQQDTVLQFNAYLSHKITHNEPDPLEVTKSHTIKSHHQTKQQALVPATVVKLQRNN